MRNRLRNREEAEKGTETRLGLKVTYYIVHVSLNIAIHVAFLGIYAIQEIRVYIKRTSLLNIGNAA